MVGGWLLEVLLWGICLHRCMLPSTTTLPAAPSKRCTTLTWQQDKQAHEDIRCQRFVRHP